MLKAYKFINQSVLDLVGIEIVEKHLIVWAKEIEDHIVNLIVESEDSYPESSYDDIDEEAIIKCSTIMKKVNNPTKTRPVSESYTRVKGALERRKIKVKTKTAKFTNDICVVTFKFLLLNKIHKSFT